ncbi:hypothetical protein QOZ80_5AG0379330 [Eleusine coracana subsp. coracana]|nr:hypothetical protein QOZ80_5AG0379330 [Eleusine coracana subsp. coracana]
MTPCYDQGTPPWADLPPELLGMVFLRLPTRADRARFPATAVPSAFHTARPSTYLKGLAITTLMASGFSLSREDDTCFLMNPFTKATMEIPNLSSYSPYYDPVETDNDHVPNYGMPGTWMDFMGSKDVSVVTLTVCSTRLIAAVLSVGDCGEYFCTIALCRPGAAAWSVRAQEQRRCLSDMVFLKGKLYTIDAFTEDLLAVDIVDEDDNSEPRMSKIERIIKGAPMPYFQYFNRVPYLLESDDTLLMIRRKISYTTELIATRISPLHVAGTSEFEVLKADFGCSLWTGTRSLGVDLALFLGRGCSRAVCVSPHDLSHDCIFFVDDYIDGWYWKNTTTSCGVYDMKDGKVYSPMPQVSWKSGKVPATWLFSQGNLDY